MANQQKEGRLTAIAGNIEAVRKLKFGALHQCRQCGDWWFLNEDMPWIERVPEDRHAAVEAWDRCTATPSEAALVALKGIGATEADTYGNGKGELKIPCRIRWADGTVSDPCLVLISKRPPIDSWRRTFRLFLDVGCIEPSAFALPFEVRIRALWAEENTMGYAPTGVLSVRGDVAILNGPVNLVHHGELMGADLRIAKPEFRYDRSIPILRDPVDEVTYVYSDWFEGCETMKPDFT